MCGRGDGGPRAEESGHIQLVGSPTQLSSHCTEVTATSRQSSTLAVSDPGRAGATRVPRWRPRVFSPWWGADPSAGGHRPCSVGGGKPGASEVGWGQRAPSVPPQPRLSPRQTWAPSCLVGMKPPSSMAPPWGPHCCAGGTRSCLSPGVPQAPTVWALLLRGLGAGPWLCLRRARATDLFRRLSNPRAKVRGRGKNQGPGLSPTLEEGRKVPSVDTGLWETGTKPANKRVPGAWRKARQEGGQGCFFLQGHRGGSWKLTS